MRDSSHSEYGCFVPKRAYSGIMDFLLRTKNVLSMLFHHIWGDLHYFSKCQNLNVFCHEICTDLHWIIQVWGKHQLNSTDLKVTIVEKYNGVFPKWNGNSVNSGNLINHWNMNWGQFKDPVSHMSLDGAVVQPWSITQEMAGSNTFTVMANILVTEFSEFN